MAIADPVADLVLLGVAAFLAPVTSLLPLPSRLRLSRHFCSRFNLFCKSSQHKFNAGEAAELWGCFTWSRGLYCQVLCLAGGEIQFGLGGASNSPRCTGRRAGFYYSCRRDVEVEPPGNRLEGYNTAMVDLCNLKGKWVPWQYLLQVTPDKSLM